VAAEYPTDEKHGINFRKSQIIAKIWMYHGCVMREAIETTEHSHNFPYENG
jgi:hypothetical protein